MSTDKIKTIKDAATVIQLLEKKIQLLETQNDLQTSLLQVLGEKLKGLEGDYVPRSVIFGKTDELAQRYLDLKEDLERTRELLNTFIIKLPDVIRQAEEKMVEKYIPKKKKRPLRRYNPFS